MSKQILAFAALVAVASFLIFNMEAGNSINSEFEAFKKAHGKFYMTSEVESYRKAVFLMNLAKIQAHNANPSKTYFQAVNFFTDLTQEEFAETYLQAKIIEEYDGLNKRSFNTEPTPNDIDWSQMGKVTAVKNQGGCGSCWAFSATGSMESLYLINNRDIHLSEQQLVDCSRGYGNNGCNGGFMTGAFQYTMAHGLRSEGDYPYVARDQNCGADGGEFKIGAYVTGEGCDTLKYLIGRNPTSVAVDAGNWSSYGGGVFNNCGNSINHGVLAVGFNGEYWKVKNSWGPGWGEGGFIRLSQGNTCDICHYPMIPIF